MKDRVVQYPHRYQLVPVAGQNGVYDLVAVPGTVTEPGTALNKGNLLSDETATMIGLGGDPSVDDALFELGSNPAAFNAYTTDLYLYITGKHPILNAGPYGDYWMYETTNNHQHTGRDIALTGNAQTITVYDNLDLSKRGV